MHRRDYKLIARVIAETAQTQDERERWTAAFSYALMTAPDNFNMTKFYEGVEDVAAALQRPASSTAGRADPEWQGPAPDKIILDDAPQHFADENTPADHYYRS